MSNTFQHYLKRCQQRINQALPALVGSTQSPYSPADDSDYLQRLDEAKRYSLLNGGKRIRPTLVYAASEAVNASLPTASIDKVAAAVEMIHALCAGHRHPLPAGRRVPASRRGSFLPQR